MPDSLIASESETRATDIAKWVLRLCFLFFIVSGFCGLVYEVVWLRIAMASFGVTTALASIVISMFMAGLGLGSWGAGRLTRRSQNMGGAQALRIYSAAELLVGVSSLSVPFELNLGRSLLLRLGVVSAWQSSQYYLLAGVWIAIALVPWCAAMGSTYPLLMTVIRRSSRTTSERSFSYLYVANVSGALLGTLVSAFLLIELLGFQGTLYVAGSLNAILAVSAFVLSRRAIWAEAPEEPIFKTEKLPGLYRLPRWVILTFLFTTGMVSMGMEVIWIRQFTPYLGNVVYVFALILAVYLLATVIGSRDYRSKAAYYLAGGSVSAWSFLAFFALVPMLAADPLVPLGGVELGFFRLSSIVLFCAMTGFLTPMLVDSWSSGDPDRAGVAYAVNIGGSIAGPLVAGFLLLPWLGERGAMGLLSVPLFAIAALTTFRKRASAVTQPYQGLNPKLAFGLASIGAILLFSCSHDFEMKYTDREVKRDYTATVLAADKGFDRKLLVNGFGMTVLTPITKYIAHLPLASMSRPPQNGLVICFGMGTSFRSMLSWGIPTTAVELEPSIPSLYGYFHADGPKLLRSPLAHVVIDDGRRFLDGSKESYDVIVVDPPPPPAAPGSSLLYSREFYEVVKRHLRKDGILQTWYPSNESDRATQVAVTKALMQSFPYVRAYWSFNQVGIHFLASMQPIPAVSSSELSARMPKAAATDFVEWGPQSDPQEQFESVLSHEVTPESLVAEDPRVPAIRDDRPINEYYLLRHLFHPDR